MRKRLIIYVSREHKIETLAKYGLQHLVEKIEIY